MEQANVEVYEKVLSETDVTDKMSVLIHWVEGERRLLPTPIPGVPVVLPVRDEFGKEYTFHLTVRRKQRKQPEQPNQPNQPNQKKYYKKPEFMFRGWHAFVVEKKLKLGERIFLWRDDRGGLRIRARHPPSLHRLFGATFLY